MFKYATEKRRKYYDKVIEIYRETGYCAKKIEKLGIVPVSNHAIQDWINNFEAENGRIKPRKVMKSNKEPNTEELDALKKKVAELEEQLKYQEMRADAYDTMIDIAEKKFNIPIRKKAGAKQ